MRLVWPTGMLLLGVAVAAAAGWLLAASGNGSPHVVYEADVPDWRWSGSSFRDQYLALLLSETDLRRARTALPDHVWRQAGAEMQRWLAEGDTAVVVAYLGQAPTGGYAIRVQRVEISRGRGRKHRHYAIGHGHRGPAPARSRRVRHPGVHASVGRGADWKRLAARRAL